MKEITLEATLKNIPQVTDFVDACLEEMDCPMKAQMQLDIAVDELFSNIARYAYAEKTGMATVKVESMQDPSGVRITFVDEGVAYNPLKAREPDITLSAEERDIGGLGIFMVKKSMDHMAYEYRDGRNILQIIKNF